jgi:pyruvate,water dikinase
MEKELSEVEGGVEFLKMFREFMDANGARAAGEFELAVPRWREDPSFVLSMIGKLMETSSASAEGGSQSEPAERHKRRQEDIKRIRRRLNPLQRMIFNRCLKSYSDFTTFRENLKYRLMEGFALLRSHFLEKGDTLCKAGKIESRDDVFYLKPREITALMSDSDSDNLRHPARLVVTRKKEMALWRSLHPPALILEGGPESEPSSSRSLTGIGCSPGTVEGVARVLFDLAESAAFVPDEILVTPHTDPGWTPLFLVCKGLVTEIGGFLSHGATVAREYGIPAVVNVPGAASRIDTGDLIRVDGTTGRITILAKN